MTPRERWSALLASGGTILADGAMGTMLMADGLRPGDPPEAWTLVRPDAVGRVHRGYLDAGARLVLTNTFGASRLRLDRHGLGARVAELNRAAAHVLRAEVDATGTGALVAGDIGPTGSLLAPLGPLEPGEAADAFAEQATALVGGGVDVIWIETMSDLGEMRAAIEGVRRVAPSIPLIATMTFDAHGRTMMGVRPEEAVVTLIGWSADAVGGNCGNGPDELVPVIASMRAAAPEAILVGKSNAGTPSMVGGHVVYTADPTTMAGSALEMRTAGARIIGGCCGSTPAHLAAMGAALGIERPG